MTKATNRKGVKPSSAKRAVQLGIADRLAKLELKKERMRYAGNAGMLAGTALGGAAGLKYGNPQMGAVLGAAAGNLLGSGIASIIGEGHYSLAGNAPKYNVLYGNGIPKFSTDRATNIVCHREYLFDMFGSSNFSVTSLPLNPGMYETFPWLSSLAQNYQEYKFHGIMFEFRALTTDYANSGVPGVVVMSTNYNSSSIPYANKQQMENAEFATSVKPTLNLAHFIECAPRETFSPIKFIRTGSVPTGQDLRLYDQGLFQFATQGNSSGVNLGEVWVTYCVEFFKPIIPPSITPGNGGFFDIVFTGATSIFTLGTAQTVQYDDIGVKLGGAILTLPAYPIGTLFSVVVFYEGANVSAPGMTITNATANNIAINGSGTPNSQPYLNSGNGTTQDNTIWFWKVSTFAPLAITFSATLSGTVYGQVQIYILPTNAS
jgi:hypothetical protein